MAAPHTARFLLKCSVLAAIAAFALIGVPAPAQTGDSVEESYKQAKIDLENKKQNCLPVDMDYYDSLVREANIRFDTWKKAQKKGLPVDGDQLKKIQAQQKEAAALRDEARQVRDQQANGCKPPQQAEKPKNPGTKAEPPVMSGKGSPPTVGQPTSGAPGTGGTASAQFTHASKLYDAAKGKCDAANMMAARAQMDAAIALQRAALDGALKAGATAIAEKLKAELKAMDDLYWSIDSSIRKCKPPGETIGQNPYLETIPNKNPISPMAVAVIAGQAGQGDGPHADSMPGSWTGMIPVGGPQMPMGQTMEKPMEGHASMDGRQVIAGTADSMIYRFLPESTTQPDALRNSEVDFIYPQPELGGPESGEIGKDFDRFMKSIDPYPEAIQGQAEDALRVGLEWTLNGEKIQPYADTKVDQPELPTKYYAPRPVNVDPDFSGPIEIDLYPNAPIYLGTDSPEPVAPDPTPGGAPLDVVSNPSDVPGLALPAAPAMTPVDSEQKLELGGGNIAVNSKPSDPGFVIGSGMERKIGESNDAAPAPVAETGSSVYGPPMTADEKIENASRQYLEARRHCNQFDMRLAQANLEAVYKSQGYSNKAAKKAAEAKLDYEWKEFSTAHPDACLPESLAPKKG